MGCGSSNNGNETVDTNSKKDIDELMGKKIPKVLFTKNVVLNSTLNYSCKLTIWRGWNLIKWLRRISSLI